MTTYTVRQGDTTAGIALRNGLLWETIWGHANNAELRSSRENQNILRPGDELYIPERTTRRVKCASEQRHRFRRRGVPEQFRLRFVADPQQTSDNSGGTGREADTTAGTGREQDRPRANIPYVLEIDGVITNGNTDRDGWVTCSIQPDAQSGRIVLNPSTAQEEVYLLQLGHLNPKSEVSGTKQRLQNLGFFQGEIDDRITQEFEAGLRTFQQRHHLTVSGEMDQATQDKLVEVNGS